MDMPSNDRASGSIRLLSAWYVWTGPGARVERRRVSKAEREIDT
jgi:hypothetical protein